MKTQYFKGLLVMLTCLLLADTLTFGQATIIDNGVPNNKWILHNPEDSRKTLFIAPYYSGVWDFNQQTQFRPNGDVNFSGNVGIGISATSRLEIYGDFRTTNGRFSSIYYQNMDGAYPTNVVNTLGNSQLTIGANWTGGLTDLSSINSNIGNTDGGGFPFWQMTGVASKRALAYLNGKGQLGIGTSMPIAYALLHVNETGGIVTTGAGAQMRFRDQKSTRTSEPWLDECAWYATDDIARFHRPDLGDVIAFSSNGNVGIGNLYPPLKLSVAGDIYSRGNMFLCAYEGEMSSGTAYLQARNFAKQAVSANTDSDLQLRSQNQGSIVEALLIKAKGNIGIGTQSPGAYKLAVEGKIGAREVGVKARAWADFVFDDNYSLPSLKTVEAHISANKHLPGIPSEAQVKRDGYALGAMDAAKPLQKIEEPTLYIIDQQKQIDELRSLVRKKASTCIV